jgi:uncharacterized protein YndB with AHSA1/START domain
MKFEVETMIAAKPEAVWSVLTNVAAWPEWTSTITRVDGRAELGTQLTLHAAISPGRAFPVTVRVMDAPRTMVFSGGMPLGAFLGERTYTLSPADGGTRFSMVEVYSGWMAWMITRTIPDLQPAFTAFAADLKRRVEG